MKRVQYSFFAISAILIAGALVGCGTTPPKDFGGRWKPLNRFAESTTAIPLYSSYVFQATPSDGTLKRMLERWAADTGMKLNYGVTSDYTLYGPIAKVNTTNLTEALSGVSAAYVPQGISISSEGGEIVVKVLGSGG